MKKIIDAAIADLLEGPIDPKRATAAAHLIAAAYPGGIDAVGGGQSPGDPPPTSPFKVGVDKVGGGQSPGDPPPTNPFSKGPLAIVFFHAPDGSRRMLRVEVDGKSVGADEVGLIEKRGDGVFALHITR